MKRKIEYLFCSEAWTPTDKLNNVVFRLSAGYIAEINTGITDDELNKLPGETTLVGRDLICAPGLIDEHIQGTGGFDFLQASIEGNEQILKNAARGGTTELLATITISNQDKELKHFRSVLNAIREANDNEHCGAKIAGVHLEGPYITPSRRGGFGIQYVKEVDLDEFKEICNIAGDILRLITIAPELPRSDLIIKYACSRGIKVAIGHTSATFEQAEEAFKSGANHITHCFNAMAGLHHREPAAITAGLLNDDVYCEVIADGVHLHPGILRLLYKIKGAERLILITDATAPCGLPPGTEFQGVGGPIKISNGGVRLPDGTLAGSALQMIAAVKNMMTLAQVSLSDALRMATLTPAQSLDLKSSGELKTGNFADFILFDKNLNLHSVIVNGFQIF